MARLKVVGWFIVCALAALFLAVLGVAAFRSGFFDSQTETEAMQIESLATFAAAIVAAELTMLGLLFTASYNERTTTLAERTEERERRGAAANFLSLLSHADGEQTAAPQLMGVITALLELEHQPVAFSVAKSALHRRDLDPTTLAALLDLFLESDDEAVCTDGVRLLRRNARRLTNAEVPGDYAFPDSLSGRWPTELSMQSQYSVVVAIGELLASQDYSWWRGFRSWPTLLLHEAMKKSTFPDVQRAAWHILTPVLGTFREPAARLWDGELVSTVQEIRSVARAWEEQEAPGQRVWRTVRLLRAEIESEWSIDVTTAPPTVTPA